MLTYVLSAIRNSGTVSVEDLSAHLNKQPETVLAALEQLVRMGYLSLSSTNGCSDGCAGCSAHNGYGGPEIRWYSLVHSK